MNGDLDEIIDALTAAEQAEKLQDYETKPRAKLGETK